MAGLAQRDRGIVSVYAQNRDYHDLVKRRLKRLGAVADRCGRGRDQGLCRHGAGDGKAAGAGGGAGLAGQAYQPSGPRSGQLVLSGRDLHHAGAAEPDAAEVSHCGSCTACLDICPTGAFPAPYQLDARRCISYLTIEHDGPVDPELRGLMGNRIYGCDDCLAVCPWNKFAVAAREIGYQPKVGLPELAELAALDDAAFRARFAGSPIKRIGRDRFVRNVALCDWQLGPACADPGGGNACQGRRSGRGRGGVLGPGTSSGRHGLTPGGVAPSLPEMKGGRHGGTGLQLRCL